MLQTTRQQVYAHNRRVWNARVANRLPHTRMASARDFTAPLRVIDAKGWLGASIAGKRVLCLAAAGGLQGILCAAAGAEVTVVDLSPAMLEQDRRIAVARGLHVRLIEGSIDDLSMLGDACFDIVLQPVSTCYVPDVLPVYREVARVTVPSGLYLSQHKQPTSLQASALPGPHGYTINDAYARSTPLPPVLGHYEHRETGALEFLHAWEDLLGGLCRSGFCIEDVQEPPHADPLAPPGSFGHRSRFLPPYVAIKARRTPQPVAPAATALVHP